MIIGRGSETKGYKDDQDERKTCPDTARRQEEPGPDDQVDEKDRQDGVKRAKQVRKGRKSTWTRERHGTRSTTSIQPKVIEVDTSVDGCDIVNAIVEQDPKHYGEAMKSGQRDQWQVAMTEELDALEANDVWKIVVPPRNAHVLHNKWVYKTKTDANGNIERCKARLVVCGNDQVFGIDYNLTFAAVMDLVTVKLILVLSKRWNVPARHGDVPYAYVKAEKEEHLDIFMKVPKGMQITKEELQGFGVESSGEVALLLKKSLYGLKQAGRLWSKLLHSKLTENGYKQCTKDMCQYYKHQGQEWTIVGAYVDDLLVTGTKQCAVDEFFAGMETLSIKDLGVVQKFLGLRISLDDTQGYILDQEVMIDVLLRDFKLGSANGVRTPIGDECNDDNKDNVDYLPARGASGEPSLSAFQSLVGSLLWIARCTRPDICFAVHKATRQTHKPTTKD
uniref:Reverse transcriptase Ty1/copia-type domain-containing protein n=1 Tax=Peronospora matthiolae TaxID=2874970 RepID=A0AAV1VL46_9STRA